jgi:hypothetical protein
MRSARGVERDSDTFLEPAEQHLNVDRVSQD